MSQELRKELQRLKNRGETALAQELESLVEAVAPEGDVPFSRRFLAQAAHEINAGQVSEGHDLIGAAVEAYRVESDGKAVELEPKVIETLKAEAAPEDAFMLPLPDMDDKCPKFSESGSEIVSSFANLLVNGGYTQEARTYLSQHIQGDKKENAMSSYADSLKEVQAHFEREEDQVLARYVRSLAKNPVKDGKTVLEIKAEAMKEGSEKLKGKERLKARRACSMLIEADENLKDSLNDHIAAVKMAKKAEDLFRIAAKEINASAPDNKGENTMRKPTLHVDAPSAREEAAKIEANAALEAGDHEKAREKLMEVKKLEKARVVAALIKAGDLDLAMEGVSELAMEEDPEGKNAGLNAEGQEGEEEEAPPPPPEPEVPEEVAEEPAADEALPPEDAEPPAEEEAPPAEEDEVDEVELADRIVETVESSIKNKKKEAAAEALKDLADLEKEIAKGIKTVEAELKNEELAKEGYAVWREVRKRHLKATAALAQMEEDEEGYEEAMKAMKELEGEGGDFEQALDDGAGSEGQEEQLPEEQSAEDCEKPAAAQEGEEEEAPPAEEEKPEGDAAEGEEVTPDVVAPPGAKAEGEEEEEEKPEEEPEEEAEAMHYEVLQSLDSIKDMKIDRQALAFTFWEGEGGKDAFWSIQASGMPIATVHLGDQDNHEDIRAYFCDEAKWPQAIAQTVENVGLYEMLKGVRARFFANEVEKTAFAQKMKNEAVASLSTTRNEKLADLRKDFVDAVKVSAEALNKGLMQNKPNTLKAAFAKTLSSYGINNPALVVESAFAEGFDRFIEQVIADAEEYLEMPKEAFAHAKKMINDASNVAQAHVNQFADQPLAQRLAQNSMPFGSVPEAEEAPAVQEQIRAASEGQKTKDLRKRLRLSNKF